MLGLAIARAGRISDTTLFVVDDLADANLREPRLNGHRPVAMHEPSAPTLHGMVLARLLLDSENDRFDLVPRHRSAEPFLGAKAEPRCRFAVCARELVLRLLNPKSGSEYTSPRYSSRSETRFATASPHLRRKRTLASSASAPRIVGHSS